MQKEKEAQTILGLWIKEHIGELEQCVIELKLEKGTSFALDRVAEHQVAALKATQGDGLYYKINDMPFIKDNPRMRYTQQKPFDCMLLKGIPAFVVIVFYAPRQYKRAFFVPIDNWLKILDEHPRKSIRQSELHAYATRIVEL